MRQEAGRGNKRVWRPQSFLYNFAVTFTFSQAISHPVLVRPDPTCLRQDPGKDRTTFSI